MQTAAPTPFLRRCPYWWVAIPGVLALLRGLAVSQTNARIGPWVVVGLFLLLVSAKRRPAH